MERATRAVGLEFAEVERFLDNSLAREGGIAVDQDCHAVLTGVIGRPVLPRSHAANRHRIDKLEVARVKAQREMHASSIGGSVVGGMPQVILYIAAAHVQLRIHVGKLAEDPLRTLPHDIGEHVEPAAMGHCQHDVVDLLRCSPLDRHLHQRNQALRALEREAFCAEKPLLDELLENGGRCHLSIDLQLLLAVELDAIFTTFHPHLQPLPNLEVVHVHELHADRPAIGISQPLDDLSQRHRLRPLDRVGRKRPVHIGFGKVVELRVKFWEPWPRSAQRIDLCHQMAADAVGPHQLIDTVLQEGHPLFAGGAGRHWQRQRHRLPSRRVRQMHIAIGDRHGMSCRDAVGRHQFLDRRQTARGSAIAAGNAVPTGRHHLRLAASNRRHRGRSSRRTEAECVEVAPPIGIHVGRVGLVLLEELLKKGDIGCSRRINTVGHAHE